MILVNCGYCGVASGYGYAVWSTYGATGGRARTYDMTKMMKILAINILWSSTDEILFEEIKTRCIFTPLKWNIKELLCYCYTVYPTKQLKQIALLRKRRPSSKFGLSDQRSESWWLRLRVIPMRPPPMDGDKQQQQQEWQDLALRKRFNRSLAP